MKKKLLITLLIGTTTLFYSCSKKDFKVKPENNVSTKAQIKSPISSIVSPATIALAKTASISKRQIGANTKLSSLASGLVEEIKEIKTFSRNGQPFFYIINSMNNEGWVILSADLNYKPVLAFGENGNFDTSNLSAGAALWFETHYKNIRYIRDNIKSRGDSTSKRMNEEAWAGLAKTYNIAGLQQQIDSLPLQKTSTGTVTPNIQQPPPPPPTDDPGTQYVYTTVNSSEVISDVTVGPLCASEWNQGYPYNMFCPSGNFSGYAPTGCVPTAMAQIMYFWQYPSTYNWGAMQTNWQYYTSGQNTDCAKLMHDIGTTSLGLSNDQFASYDDDETGANDANCPYVFGQFGYHAERTTSLAGQQISGSKNGTDYASFLYNEVSANNRPCMLAGYTKLNNVLFVNYPSGDGT